MDVSKIPYPTMPVVRFARPPVAGGFFVLFPRHIPCQGKVLARVRYPVWTVRFPDSRKREPTGSLRDKGLAPL
jgi:hypothetical protein